MNAIKLVDQLRSTLLRPWVLQMVSGIFIVLVVWEVWYGVFFFKHVRQEITIRLDASKAHPGQNENKLAVSNRTHAIFGEYVPKNLDAAGIRQSTLNFVVVGVLLAGNEKNSQVILQKPNGEQFFFNVGDTLPGGGVIKRITGKGVLVARDGALERLSLPKDELHFEPPPKPMGY